MMCAQMPRDEIKNWPARPNWFFFLLAFAICIAVACKANAAEEKEVVGRKAAEKYFKEEANPVPADSAGGGTDHFMAVHIGTFFNDESFAWGNVRNLEDVGRINVGVTYRMGEWSRSMDLLFRGEWQSYEVDGGDASKLSFMPMLQFPEASSRFPLYFGLGVGLGVFTKQISGESDVSLDYQLIGGTRWFDLFGSAGIFAEFGLKNHFHIFSSGQLNSLSLALGAVFTF